MIPQEYRDLFGITSKVTLNIIPKATGIFIQPISKVVPEIATSDLYEQVLEKQQVGGGTMISMKQKEREEKLSQKLPKGEKTNGSFGYKCHN